MSVLDKIRGWFRSNGSHLVVTFIDHPDGATPLKPHESYFRVWLSDSFLSHDVEWFTNRYPAVHASVKLDFAGQSATFTTFARPPEGGLGPGQWTNFNLTTLMPYRGGVVELAAGLTAIEGNSRLGAAFDVLQDFSGLIGPPLTEALTIAEKVSGGVEKLVYAGQDDVLLGIHQSYEATGGGGQSPLRPGYLAIVNATGDDVSSADLRVVEDRLHLARGEGTKPLEEHDYMLLRIEGRQERDDWRFKRFEDLLAKAVRAHFGDDAKGFASFRDTLLAEILTTPDLTTADQVRVAQAVSAELAAATSLPLAAAAEPVKDLAEIVALRAPAVEDVDVSRQWSVRDVLEAGSAGA